MLNSFKDYMLEYVDMSEEEWDIKADLFKSISFKKGEVISRVGDVHDKIYFINSGLARAYTLDGEGKDYTWSIYFNDENAHMINLFMTDYDSFINKSPSRLEIEALEDSQFIYLTYDDIEYLHQKTPKMLLFSKMMSDLAYCYLHHRVIDAQSKSAKERFEEFMKTTPHLLDKVPQYHVASFLGMTPIHLSRLKKELLS